MHLRHGVTVARRGMLVAMQQSDLYLSVMHAQKMYATQCCVVLLLALHATALPVWASGSSLRAATLLAALWCELDGALVAGVGGGTVGRVQRDSDSESSDSDSHSHSSHSDSDSSVVSASTVATLCRDRDGVVVALRD